LSNQLRSHRWFSSFLSGFT